MTFLGFGYILYTLKKEGLLKFSFPDMSLKNPFWRITLIKLTVISVITILYVNLVAPDKLFAFLLQKPKEWIAILFIYTFLSVWPQEIIYRTFFYNRYADLISNKWLFIFLNAALFSLAHIFLRSYLVQLLTFIGGILFAYTYQKTKSTTLVSVEHAIYGNWLFTVGMGDMLAFPGVE